MMAFLMRKYNPCLWTQEQHSIAKADDLDAEVFIDLKADSNALSTWYVGMRTEEEIKKAVLALTSGFRSLDGINVVFIDLSELERAGFSIENTKGETKIEEYASLHRDISALRAGNLMTFAYLLLGQVWKDEVSQYNTDMISKWLIESMNEHLLKFGDLNQGLRSSLADKTMKLAKKGIIRLDELDSDLHDAIASQFENNKLTNRRRCIYEAECERYHG